MKRFGEKSLLFIGISIILLTISLFADILYSFEIIRTIIFIGSIILFIASFILSIVGLIKDDKKIYSIISLCLSILTIIFIILFFTVLLPSAMKDVINSMQKSYGVK